MEQHVQAKATSTTAVWPGHASWIDLVAVRESLLSCVARSTGTVDEDRLLALEFQHNRRVAADVIDAVPVDSSFGIVRAWWSMTDSKEWIDGRTLYIVRHQDDQFKLMRDWPSAWSTQEMADGIASAMSVVAMYACGRGDFDPSYFDAMESLWDDCWLRAVAVALGDGPGCGPWTAQSIDATGAVLRTLLSICERRFRNCRGARAPLPCSDRARKLAKTIANKYDIGGSCFPHDKNWRLIMDTERSLRGMLGWIDAMECTDVLFEHMLKEHQARRIDNALSADARIAPAP